MSIPTIFDWLEYFSFLRGYPATWILLATGILIVLFLDWRLSLFALIVQYLVASLLFFDLLDSQLAIVKLFVGMFVCLILYWTARQVNYGHATTLLKERRSAFAKTHVQIGALSVSRVLAERIVAILISLIAVALLVWGFSLHLPGFPENLPYINLAILLLMALGTAGLITGGDPLPAGMSVLTFLTGFELYFAALDQTTRTLAIVAALDFALALIVSYLTQRRYASFTAAISDD